MFSVVFHLCYLCLSLVKRPDAIYKHARAYFDKISQVHAYTLIYMHTFTHSRANKYIAQWTALIVKSIGLFCALYPTFTVSKDSNKIYFWSFVHLILGFANFICPVSFSVFLTTPFFLLLFFSIRTLIEGNNKCVLTNKFANTILMSILFTSVHCFLQNYLLFRQLAVCEASI